MELKFVIPNMKENFGNLKFAGEDKVKQRRVNGQPTILSRSYNIYSDVQRADDIVVVLRTENVDWQEILRHVLEFLASFITR